MWTVVIPPPPPPLWKEPGTVSLQSASSLSPHSIVVMSSPCCLYTTPLIDKQAFYIRVEWFNTLALENGHIAVEVNFLKKLLRPCAKLTSTILKGNFRIGVLHIILGHKLPSVRFSLSKITPHFCISLLSQYTCYYIVTKIIGITA